MAALTFPLRKPQLAEVRGLPKRLRQCFPRAGSGDGSSWDGAEPRGVAVTPWALQGLDLGWFSPPSSRGMGLGVGAAARKAPPGPR